jgi:hypothetical protein
MAAGGGTVNGNLSNALKQFRCDFDEARTNTQNDPQHKERGFVVYMSSNGKLYLSDMLTGKAGVIDKEWDDEFEIPTAQNIPKGVTLSLGGIYHSHPYRGKDNNPLSVGDIFAIYAPFGISPYVTFSGTGVYSTTNCGISYICQTGFFDIADDLGGGRYGVVIENKDIFNQNKRASFDKLNRQWDLFNGAFGIDTAGKLWRAIYKATFSIDTGLGVYYNENIESTNLNRQ